MSIMRLKKKSQIISMDFIMTFLVYIFSLAIFFSLISSSFFDRIWLTSNTAVIFSRIENDYEQNFLRGPVIDKAALDSFLSSANASEKYSLFKGLENKAYSNINYCIYLKNHSQIIRNFAAYSNGYENMIFLNSAKCGTNPTLVYDVEPECKIPNSDSIVLEKPVLFGRDIVKLKVLVCAKKL